MTTGATWVEGPVVVPLDGRDSSVRALPLAERIVRSLGADLRVISVVGDEADREKRIDWMNDVASAHLQDVQPDVEAFVSDDTAGAIATSVETGGMICMATAGKIRFHSGHFGSVAEGVARALARPLLMVGPNVDPNPNGPTARVVLPVDGSEMAESACGVAADLAVALGAPLWVITVMSPSALAAAAAKHGGAGDAFEVGHLVHLARELSADRGIDVQYEVLHSENPDRAIVDFVGDDGMAVMSTHGRTGLGRVFAGSITAGVVAHSRRAVAVLRPEGID